ncbi:MAG: dephospho-CoA kinase, partial [Lachnospiraceae bacterium]|nr:dephospho-CoA kinase [Lachnospiraceae bacterium]
MKVIGITGGVGAGKSVVLDFIKNNYKAFILQADEVAHELMEPGMPANKLIAEAFPDAEVLDEKGYINKPVLSSLIFTSGANRRRVNSIVHPMVKSYVTDAIKTQRKSGEYDYFIYEAGLLLDGETRDYLDEIWYIYAPESVRRQRLKDDRGYTDEKIDGIF